MAIVQSLKNQLVPIHKEGYPFIAVAVIITLGLFCLALPLGLIGLALTVWCVLFFRDPVRVSLQDARFLISPADGVVCAIETALPPAEIRSDALVRTRISIFMSVFDCHVNRAPYAGRISKIAYRPGKFLNADLDKASEDNERQSFTLTTAVGEITVVQIAGLIARRIVRFLDVGALVKAGTRLGLIRFGSRVDVYLPEGVLPRVDVG